MSEADIFALPFAQLQCARSSITAALGAMRNEEPQFKGLDPYVMATQAKRELARAIRLLKDCPHV